MEQIIAEILAKYAKKIVEEIGSGEKDFDEMIKAVEAPVRTVAVEIVEAAVRQLDAKIRADKVWRKEEGLLIHEKEKSKGIVTTLGPIEVTRTVYKDKENGKNRYLLDEMLGLEKRQRISNEGKAAMLMEATKESYARSVGHAMRHEVSRQSVYTAIRRIRLPQEEIVSGEDKKRAVSVLHVFADEDHVHMQKPNRQKGKKNRNVPVVTVTEGIREVNTGRMETINGIAFADEHFCTKQLWKTVAGYILSTYDMTQVEKIYVYGDGANWIKNGLSELEKTVHVIDGYHWEKELKRVSGKVEEKNFRKSLRALIRKGDKEKVTKKMAKIYDEAPESKKKAILEFTEYLLGQWEAIRNYYVEDKTVGSCTEAMVSHLLSERFSRDPAGWGEESLGRLSVLRIYVLNGNTIRAEAFRKAEKATNYADYYAQQMKKWLAEANDWSIFDPIREPFDGNSGTQALIHYYGQAKMEYIN